MDDFLRILQLIMYHRNRTDRLIIRQHRPVNIQDPASGCLDIPFSFMKIRSLFIIIFRTEQHQPGQTSHQPKQHDRTENENQQDLFFMKNLQ